MQKNVKRFKAQACAKYPIVRIEPYLRGAQFMGFPKGKYSPMMFGRQQR